MISFITTGSDFGGLAEYLHGPGSANEHVDARVIGSNHVVVTDPRRGDDWAKLMNYTASLNRRVRKPAWHCSISAPPEERELTDIEWAQFATDYMKEMKFDDNAWVAVRHGDNHIHVAASRVDLTGKCWRNPRDFKDSAAALRKLERRYGLIVVDETRQRQDPAHAKTSKAEREKAKRKRQPMPARAMLRDEVAGAVRAARGRGIRVFEDELKKRRLSFRAKLDNRGVLVGYSVSIHGWVDADGKNIWAGTSKLDKDLKWQNIKAELDPRNARLSAHNIAPVSSIGPISAIVPRSPR